MNVKTPQPARVARQIVQDVLTAHGFNNPLGVKTVSFSDLARGAAIVATIRDWTPAPAAKSIEDDIRKRSAESNIRIIVQFSGPGIVG